MGSGGLKVASANLLNLFNTYTGCTFGAGGAAADCRGANNDAEYQRQLAKEVDSITFLGADVVGFMEMENDGYGADSAVQALVNALNAKDGAGAWAFVNPDAATGTVNAAGTDAIKAGLLYRTAKVAPVAGATFADQAAGVFERNPVAQTFVTPAGAKLTVVANHFKSKGSCPTTGPDTDQGDGQACWNARRTAQATELARWVRETVVPAAGDPDVMLVGDLNSYAGEDPIAVLADAGFVNLVTQFGEPTPYSYVFDGQWGYLDYVLASASLRPQVTGAGDAHHNADEPSVLDYNTEFKSAGQVASLYAPDRFRTSDHDPVLAGIALTAPAPTVTLTSSRNPSAVLAPVTFTATVTGAAAGSSVTFSARGVPLGPPVAVVGGKATSRPVGVLPPGTTTVTATLSGGGGIAGSVVQTVLLPPAFLGTPPPGRVGTPYRFAFVAPPSAVFSVTAGALPAGLTLSPTGVLSGTPTAAGPSTFTVRATNAVGSRDRAFTVRVVGR